MNQLNVVRFVTSALAACIAAAALVSCAGQYSTAEQIRATPPRHNSCRLLRTKNPGGGDEGNQWHATDNHSRTGQ